MKAIILKLTPILFYLSLFFVISTCDGNNSTSTNHQQMMNMKTSNNINDLKNTIITHLQSGDIDKLSSYFSKEISLGILGEEEEISPNSAKILLKDFYTKNLIINFKVLHNGQSKDGSGQFLIGSLNVKKGKKYRVFIEFNKSEINLITIE